MKSLQQNRLAQSSGVPWLKSQVAILTVAQHVKFRIKKENIIMPKTQDRVGKYAKQHPLKREVSARNSSQNQVRTHQQLARNTHPPQENHNFGPPPPLLAGCAYTIVTLQIMFCGTSTANLPLIYLAASMAAAPLGSPVLKTLVDLIKEKLFK